VLPLLTRIAAILIAATCGLATVAGQTKPQPQVPSVSKRPNGASLGTIRAGGADNNIWFGWRVAVPSTAIAGLTFSDSLAKADILSVTSVEAVSTQITAYEVPKPLDDRLQPGERNAVVYRLCELHQQIAAYRVEDLGPDAASRRRMFELAKAINAPLIVTRTGTIGAADLAELDALAEELGMSVALESQSDPQTLVRSLEGRSRRLGVAVDLGAWMREGIAPLEGLRAVKDRLMLVRVADRSALGAKGRPVVLGEGVGALGDFFLTLYRAGVKPLAIVVESAGTSEADMRKNLSAFERVMWPAMAERVRHMVESPAGQIRGGDRLSPEERQAIEAAVPRRAVVTPQRPRRMLVTDLQMYSGHSTIPHGNLLLELMAKYTGAFEPVFSNDLELLKYPRITEFDAVYLNNVCGMVHNDPEVREGLLRFVREGGGIGGHHAVTYANNHWPEFAEMMGGWAGAHRVETQMLKIDDAHSPLTRSFGSGSFAHTDEFYIFPPSSPYSRAKQRVLLSVDVEASDRATMNRFCEACTRPDQDYGVAWVKAYGKGRTYFTPLGHTNIFYTDTRWTEHLLAAIQYILGDLEVDARPAARSRTSEAVKPR
jgi:sugar phosphate isomerase/epimerase/type 1 glutamine amidotransferase